MTAYAVSTTAIGAGFTLGLMPGTLPVRIARLEVCGIAATSSGQADLAFTAAVYTGSTPTGGSSITPFAMRHLAGTPAASATAKSGATISGTNIVLHAESQDASILSTAGGTAVSTLNSTYTTAFDLILLSGTTFWVVGTETSGSFTAVVIYFEELRDNWAV